MAKKNKKNEVTEDELIKREEAMIEGIMEGSPDAVGVVVIRLDCGCRKMAAVDKEGEPASKIIMYRDFAESICDKCKDDQGDYSRITRQFIDWREKNLDDGQKKNIMVKVFGTADPEFTTH